MNHTGQVEIRIAWQNGYSADGVPTRERRPMTQRNPVSLRAITNRWISEVPS